MSQFHRATFSCAVVLVLAGTADARVKAPVLTRSHLPPLTWSDVAKPSPLAADEEALPVVEALAHRFNPAMAFPTRDIWPVEVRYAWHDGAPLMARVVTESGRSREYVALTHDRLVAGDLGDLPAHDAAGNRIDYYVDAPGDDRIESGATGWRRRWRAIMNGEPSSVGGGAAPRGQAARGIEYPPTQYCHLFWFNRDKGLLAIQYWFYYPYNEWINHHEGDWERINVVVRGPSRLTDNATFRVVGYQFFFHTWTYEPDQVVRISGSDAREDHVVVYAGGRSRFLLWSGSQSGGSYPLPAVFPAAGGGVGRWRPADDTSKPARFIHPGDFKVILLPEPDRLDVGASPELAWLRLSFFAGQPRMYKNPLRLNAFTFGTAPQQPARQGGWNSEWNPPLWPDTPRFDPAGVKLPRGWQAVMQAQPKVYQAVAARRATRTR